MKGNDALTTLQHTYLHMHLLSLFIRLLSLIVNSVIMFINKSFRKVNIHDNHLRVALISRYESSKVGKDGWRIYPYHHENRTWAAGFQEEFHIGMRSIGRCARSSYRCSISFICESCSEEKKEECVVGFRAASLAGQIAALIAGNIANEVLIS